MEYSEKWITPGEAAEVLNCNSKTVMKHKEDYVTNGKVGKATRFWLPSLSPNYKPVDNATQTPQEKDDVIKANSLAEIAEARQRENEAILQTEARKVGMTAEKFIDAVKNLSVRIDAQKEREAEYHQEIEQAIKEAKAKYEVDAKEARANNKLYLNGIETTGKENEKLREQNKALLMKIETLSLQINDNLEEEVELSDDITQFATNNVLGIKLLNQSYSYLDDNHKYALRPIIEYLIKVDRWIVEAQDRNRMLAVYETSMKAYNQAELIINNNAGIYQTQSMKSGIFNRGKIDYSSYVKALMNITTRLETTMNYRLVPAGDGGISPNNIQEETPNV